MSRPCRFGVSLVVSAPADEWSAKRRRAEELGYDVILVPDHLGTVAPFPALVAAARATERPLLGTSCSTWASGTRRRRPGRWRPRTLSPADGRNWGSAPGTYGRGARQGRAALRLGRGTGGPSAARHRGAGAAARRPGAPGAPGPAARGPLLIGANGDRMLELTARHAAVAAFTGGRTLRTRRLAPITAEGLDERVARYREPAADRTEPAELNLLIQMVDVTEDREAAVRPFLERVPHLTPGQVLDLPIFLTGTVERIAAQLRAQRERYGFTYLTVLEPYTEAFAPVMRALRED